MTSQLSQSEYLKMLIAFLSPWQSLMPFLKQLPEKSLQSCLENKFKALENDIKVLSPNELPEIPFIDIKHSNETIDSVLGYCYVVVGSSLGAQVLSEKVNMALPGAPKAYLFSFPR